MTCDELRAAAKKISEALGRPTNQLDDLTQFLDAIAGAPAKEAQGVVRAVVRFQCAVARWRPSLPADDNEPAASA
jgi:hypothetical protein